MMLHICDICGDEYMLGEAHDCKFRLIGQRDAALYQLSRERVNTAAFADEAARYRAALEEIEVPSLDITDGDPRCNYCYHEHPEHSPFCPTGIAHRALHPEEEG